MADLEEPYAGNNFYVLRQLPFRGSEQETVSFEIVDLLEPILPGSIEIIFEGSKRFRTEILESIVSITGQLTVPYKTHKELENAVIRQVKHQEFLRQIKKTSIGQEILTGNLVVNKHPYHPVKRIHNYR